MQCFPIKLNFGVYKNYRNKNYKCINVKKSLKVLKYYVNRRRLTLKVLLYYRVFDIVT